jgi:hypothetical protein
MTERLAARSRIPRPFANTMKRKTLVSDYGMLPKKMQIATSVSFTGMSPRRFLSSYP